MALKLSEHGLSAVQSIEQPEQRHIGHGKIRHPFVAFPAHIHQAAQAGTQLGHQLLQLGHQPAATLDGQERGKKRLIKLPRPLRILLQAGDRTGQVIAVVLMGETQRQLRAHHRNLAGIFPKGVADIPPALPIANRTLSHLIGFQAVAAVRPQQRKGQYHHHVLRFILKRQYRWQIVSVIRID